MLTDFNKPRGSNGDYARVILNTLAELRTFKPWFDGQVVTIKKVTSTGPEIFDDFYYDLSDTTSADDGIFVIKTTQSTSAFKRIDKSSYNIAYFGLLADGSNFSTAVNNTVLAIVNDIIANNRVNNVMTTIKIPSLGKRTVFTIDASIKLPTIVTLFFEAKTAYLDAKNFTADAVFKITNDFTGLTTAMFQAETSWSGGPANQAIGNAIIDSSGRIALRGPGYATATNSAIIFGNTVNGVPDVRDVRICAMNIFGFNISHTWGTYNTYMCGFAHCNFSRCNYGAWIPDVVYNSGERMKYFDCTFGNIKQHCFYAGSSGNYTLEDVSTDFIEGDLFHFGPTSANFFNFKSGHIEGIYGYIASKDTPTNYSQARVEISKDVVIDPRTTTNYRGIRKMYNCPITAYGKGLAVINGALIPSMINTKPNTAYSTWSGSPTETGCYIEHPRTYNQGTPWPNSYASGVTNRINPSLTFTTTDTAVGTDLLSVNEAFAVITTGTAIAKYSNAGNGDADGIIPFEITLASASDTVQLFCTNQSKNVSAHVPLWGTCSVKIGSSTGDVQVSPIMASYRGATINSIYNDTAKTVASTLNPIRRSITVGSATSMTASLVDSGLTSAQFQAMYPRFVTGHWQGADFFVPGFLFTGFVGTIYVKLPYWWFDTGRVGY